MRVYGWLHCLGKSCDLWETQSFADISIDGSRKGANTYMNKRDLRIFEFLIHSNFLPRDHHHLQDHHTCLRPTLRTLWWQFMMNGSLTFSDPNSVTPNRPKSMMVSTIFHWTTYSIWSHCLNFIVYTEQTLLLMLFREKVVKYKLSCLVAIITSLRNSRRITISKGTASAHPFTHSRIHFTNHQLLVCPSKEYGRIISFQHRSKISSYDQFPFLSRSQVDMGCWRRFRKAWGHLSIVKAVLLDAEEQQGHNQEQTVWLGKLKNIFYDAEDVLDEFKCEALRRQVVKTYGSSTRKVRCFPSSSNPLVFCFKVGHKIKEVRVSNS